MPYVDLDRMERDLEAIEDFRKREILDLETPRDKRFKDNSLRSWALDEIIKEVVERDSESVLDILEDFDYRMARFIEDSETEEDRKKFTIAQDIAYKLALEFT